MARISTCGFEAISKTFRKSTERKGQKLFEAGHVFNVREIKEVGKEAVIVGECKKQTKIQEKYKIELTLDEGRHVTSGRCQCVSGAEASCKHSSALVWFINAEREESQTDRERTWNRPSSKAQKRYPKGKPTREIFKLPASEPLTFAGPTEDEKAAWTADLEDVGGEKSMMYKILLADQEVIIA